MADNSVKGFGCGDGLVCGFHNCGKFHELSFLTGITPRSNCCDGKLTRAGTMTRHGIFVLILLHTAARALIPALTCLLHVFPRTTTGRQCDARLTPTVPEVAIARRGKSARSTKKITATTITAAWETVVGVHDAMPCLATQLTEVRYLYDWLFLICAIRRAMITDCDAADGAGCAAGLVCGFNNCAKFHKLGLETGFTPSSDCCEGVQ